MAGSQREFETRRVGRRPRGSRRRVGASPGAVVFRRCRGREITSRESRERTRQWRSPRASVQRTPCCLLGVVLRPRCARFLRHVLTAGALQQCRQLGTATAPGRAHGRSGERRGVRAQRAHPCRVSACARATRNVECPVGEHKPRSACPPSPARLLVAPRDQHPSLQRPLGIGKGIHSSPSPPPRCRQHRLSQHRSPAGENRRDVSSEEQARRQDLSMGTRTICPKRDHVTSRPAAEEQRLAHPQQRTHPCRVPDSVLVPPSIAPPGA